MFDLQTVFECHLNLFQRIFIKSRNFKKTCKLKMKNVTTKAQSHYFKVSTVSNQ